MTKEGVLSLVFRYLVFLTVAGVSVAGMAGPAIVGIGTWDSSIAQGQLELVSLVLTLGAVGATLLVTVKGLLLRYFQRFVLLVGVVTMVGTAFVYGATQTLGDFVSPGSVRTDSYAALGASLLCGLAETYLTHRSE